MSLGVLVMAAYRVDGKSDLKVGLLGLGIAAVWLVIVAFVARMIAVG